MKFPTTAGMTAAERTEVGKSERARVPRRSHGEWDLSLRPRQPLDILEEQARTRVPDLVPIRHGRMAASPFAYYRGAAAPMAADLSKTPRTDLIVQLCGDAHLLNFGGFASPERSMIFDVNDFDETLPGPFEWDVKRLAASLDIAARSREIKRRERARVVSSAVRMYRQAMAEFAQMRTLDLWYVHLDLNGIISRWGAAISPDVIANLERGAAKAANKDNLRALRKLTTMVDGEPRIISDPPLLVPASEVWNTDEANVDRLVEGVLQSYRKTLEPNRRQLLERYTYLQLARKVVGVGSVGTRAWLVLLVGRDAADPLFLQVKEAQPSVLEPYLGRSVQRNHGQRVVEGQRLMQAASDIFLGWDRVSVEDLGSYDFYFRQLWDRKVSADIESMQPDTLPLYGQMCAWTLARAHARSGDPIAISAYLGTSEAFDEVMADFANLYADQNDLDHQALVDAIKAGEVAATLGI
jgi:uncharacterized protein (DUF2252 family)